MYTENLIPQMTGYNMPSGLVIYSGNYNSVPGYLAYNAFDKTIGIDQARWASQSSSTKYIGYKFEIAKKITKYNIYGEFYSAGTQSPKSWQLEASNNGKFSYNGGILNADYYILDTQTNQTNWAPCEKREFFIQNNNNYLYYVLTNIINNGGTAVSISEIEMMESLILSYYLIKQDGQYLSIKQEFYEELIHNFIPISLNNPITANDIINNGFNDLSVLTNIMNINNDNFRPIDKLKNDFDLISYKLN